MIPDALDTLTCRDVFFRSRSLCARTMYVINVKRVKTRRTRHGTCHGGGIKHGTGRGNVRLAGEDDPMPTNACVNCGCGLTWSNARRAYARLVQRGMPQDEAKRRSPTCERCATALLRERSVGPVTS